MSEPLLFGEIRWSSLGLGEALGLTAQRVNGLVREGVISAPVDGRYLPRAAVLSYVLHLRKREAGHSQAGEALRKARLENEMRSIRLLKISGELVPLDTLRKDWFEVGRRVRDSLLNLPPRLAGVFAAEASAVKIFDSLTKEIHQVLQDLSARPARPQEDVALPLDSLQEEKPIDELGRIDPLAQDGELDRFPTGD